MAFSLLTFAVVVHEFMAVSATGSQSKAWVGFIGEKGPKIRQLAKHDFWNLALISLTLKPRDFPKKPGFSKKVEKKGLSLRVVASVFPPN